MNEQEMQFADPAWQPSTSNQGGAIQLDPQEREPSHEIRQEEDTIPELQPELPDRERDKLELSRSARRKVPFRVTPVLLLGIVLSVILAFSIRIPQSSPMPHPLLSARSSSPHRPDQRPQLTSMPHPLLSGTEIHIFPVHDYLPTSSGDNEPIVVIKDDVGSIHVHYGHVGEPRRFVTVQVTKHANGGDFKGMHLAYEQGGPNNNTITITANSGAGVSDAGSIDLNIIVPFGSSTQLSVGSGLVQIGDVGAGTQASAQVSIGSGSVDIDGMEGEIAVQSSSASVRLRDLGGTISAETVSGSIYASSLSGGVTLESSTGSITAINVRWGVTITTGSAASITVTNATLSEASSFTTDAGSLNFQGTLEYGDAVQFMSGNGSVNVALPGSSAFHLEATTVSGSITNDFGSSDTGNGQRAILTIRTERGSIHLQKEKG